MTECHKDDLVGASEGISKASINCRLRWHPVTKEMNSTQYQLSNCMDEVKIQVAPSIKSFFTKATGPKMSSEKQSSGKQVSKRRIEASTISITSNKKAKKGTINHFFKKK